MFYSDLYKVILTSLSHPHSWVLCGFTAGVFFILFLFDFSKHQYLQFTQGRVKENSRTKKLFCFHFSQING